MTPPRPRRSQAAALDFYLGLFKLNTAHSFSKKEVIIMVHDHGNATGTPCCPICCAAFLREHPQPENGVSDICRLHSFQEKVEESANVR